MTKEHLITPDGRRIRQKEVAEVLNIPESTASKMLRGETRLGVHMMVCLWRAYDLGPEAAVRWARIIADRYEKRRDAPAENRVTVHVESYKPSPPIESPKQIETPYNPKGWLEGLLLQKHGQERLIDTLSDQYLFTGAEYTAGSRVHISIYEDGYWKPLCGINKAQQSRTMFTFSFADDARNKPKLCPKCRAAYQKLEKAAK